MVKEKCLFRLAVVIEEGKLGHNKELVKKSKLVVDWNKSTGEIERQIVEFEKDGKKYKFELEVSIKKGWFKDKITSFNFVPVSGERFTVFEYVFGEPKPENMKTRLMGKEERTGVIPLQSRSTGLIMIGGIMILFLFVSIVAYFFWKKSKSVKSQKKKKHRLISLLTFNKLT